MKIDYDKIERALLDRICKYFGRFMSDQMFLKLMYKVRLGRKLDLREPKTFNAKLQWLKLYDRNPRYTELVDKIKVKEYIAGIIGEKYIIPTLKVFNSAKEIDFSELPNEFVLKCNHDSGTIYVCEDKRTLSIERMNDIRDYFDKALKRDWYLLGREWPYKNVSRKIFAESYMSDKKQDELIDYKFMCFDGKVKCSFVCSDRKAKDGLKVTFFDREWNVMPFERHYPKSEKEISCPQNYDLMIRLAEKVSENIPFVRVDFYEIEGEIYFGEMTFYPGCGFEEFNPEEWDYELGKWIELGKIDAKRKVN